MLPKEIAKLAVEEAFSENIASLDYAKSFTFQRTNLDLAFHGEVNLRESMRLQFRAEAFNVTNTAAFGNPGSSSGSGTFGVISSAGLGRNIQLALKLLF